MLGLARATTTATPVSVAALAAARKSELLAAEMMLSSSVSAEVDARRKALAEAERLRQVQADLQNIQKDVLRARQKEAQAKAATAAAQAAVKTEEQNLLNLLNGGLDELELEETKVQPLVEPQVQPLAEPQVQQCRQSWVEPLVQPVIQLQVEPQVQGVTSLSYMQAFDKWDNMIFKGLRRLDITQASEDALMRPTTQPTTLEEVACGGSYILLDEERVAPEFQILKSYAFTQPDKGIFVYEQGYGSTPELISPAKVTTTSDGWEVKVKGRIGVPNLATTAPTAPAVDCPPPFDFN